MDEIIFEQQDSRTKIGFWGAISRIFSFGRRHKIISIIFIILVVIFGWRLVTARPDLEEKNDKLPKISVVKVSEINSRLSNLNITGEVESIAQAELKSEVSGRIVGVYKNLGDRVFAGQSIIAVDGSALSAQYNQAQAGVDVAQAGLDELKKGATQEQIDAVETNLQNTKNSLNQLISKTAIVSSQTALDEIASTLVAHSDIQQRYFNNAMYHGFRISSAKENLINFVYGQSNLGYTLPWLFLIQKGGLIEKIEQLEISTDKNKTNNLLSEVRIALDKTKILLDATRIGLNDDNGSVTDKTIIDGKRSIINGQIVLITGQEQAIITTQGIVDSAQKQLDLIKAPATGNRIKISESQLKQAQASLALIGSQLSKTIIRSPINGIISSLDPNIRVGNLINPSQNVASVINTNGYNIRAFIDSESVDLISKNSEVKIKEDINGILSIISPGLNLQSRKIEIKINITDSNPDLIVGEFVNVSIPISSKDNGPILLPLSAIRISTDGSFVLTLNEENITEKIEVKLGEVIGESIEILDGLNEDDLIIPSIRGLDYDQKVEIN